MKNLTKTQVDKQPTCVFSDRQWWGEKTEIAVANEQTRQGKHPLLHLLHIHLYIPVCTFIQPSTQNCHHAGGEEMLNKPACSPQSS